MGRAVDADREPRYDAGADRREVGGQARRHGPAVIGRPSRPDDGHGRRRVECGGITQHRENVRRHVDRGEPARERRIVEGHDRETHLVDPLQRGLGRLGRGGDPDRHVIGDPVATDRPPSRSFRVPARRVVPATDAASRRMAIALP